MMYGGNKLMCPDQSRNHTRIRLRYCVIMYYPIRSYRLCMSKTKLIRFSDLDESNRKLLATARQAGLCPDEIIRKSLEAAYSKLLQSGDGGGTGRTTAVAGKDHISYDASSNP